MFQLYAQLIKFCKIGYISVDFKIAYIIMAVVLYSNLREIISILNFSHCYTVFLFFLRSPADRASKTTVTIKIWRSSKTRSIANYQGKNYTLQNSQFLRSEPPSLFLKGSIFRCQRFRFVKSSMFWDSKHIFYLI